MSHAILIMSLMASSLVTAAPPRKPKIAPGAYSQVKPEDALVIQAQAEVQRHLSLIKINRVEKAEKQVVAGMNVKLTCWAGNQGETERWEFTVYRDLKGKFRLTSAQFLGGE